MEKTDAWELGATVAALWRAALLLCVLVLELSSWRLDDPNFVRTCVVPSRSSSVIDPKSLELLLERARSYEVDLRIPPSLRTNSQHRVLEETLYFDSHMLISRPS